MNQDTIAVIDLGSARTTEIARAIRKVGVYTELHPHDLTAAQLAAIPNLRGLVLASGPRRAYEGQVVEPSPAILEAGLPLLAVDDAGDPEPDLAAFVFKTGATRDWDMDNFIADQVEAIRAQVGDKKVLLALSGGVDSSVVAALLIRAIGKQLTCVHVNHGLLRKGEPEQVIRVFREELGANLVYVDATDRFLGGKAHRTCVFCMVGATVFMGIFVMFPQLPTIVSTIFLAMSGFCIYGPQALVGVAIANQATKDLSATANGLNGILGYIGSFLSALGVGILADHFGWNTVFVVIICVGAVGGLVFALMWRAPRDGYERANNFK